MREHGTQPRRRAAAIAALALAAAAASPGRTAAADADADAYRRILEQRSPAVVTVRFVLDIQLGGTMGGAMGDRGQEVETEISGVVIDPSGLVLCSNTLIGGFAGLMGRLMGGGSELQITATPKDIEILVGDSTQGLPARLVARDTDLDLAWLRLAEPPASPLAAIDLATGAAARVGDPFVAVRRLDKLFARAPALVEGRIGGAPTKPRRLWVPAAQTAGHGLPVFDTAGELIGVTVMQFPDDDGLTAGGGMAAMLQSTRLEEVLSAVILPASEVARATELAREIEAQRAGDEGVEAAADREDADQDADIEADPAPAPTEPGG
jgi:S1-C subfamily serine protease